MFKNLDLALAEAVKANPRLSDVAEFACHQVTRKADLAAEAAHAVSHALKTGLLEAPDYRTQCLLRLEVYRRMQAHWQAGRWQGAFKKEVPELLTAKQRLD